MVKPVDRQHRTGPMNIVGGQTPGDRRVEVHDPLRFDGGAPDLDHSDRAVVEFEESILDAVPVGKGTRFDGIGKRGNGSAGPARLEQDRRRLDEPPLGHRAVTSKSTPSNPMARRW